MAEGRVFGIDLGTTYSCIAHVDEHGKPVVVPNSNNQLTTPSVVYFEPDGEIIAGEAAREAAVMEPSRTVFTVKRSMGDPDWQQEFDGKTYLPQDISSFILRKIVNDASAVTGEAVKDVVITVPAYFGINEREATKQAGELAGLNVLYVIPEPTAAAIAYGMDREDNQVLMVYDLGGGTFDITMIEVKRGLIDVICTGGDHQLGGKNWDEVIAQYFADQFAEQTGRSADEIIEDAEAYPELLAAAERCKIALTSRSSFPHKVQFDGDRAKVELTREKFDEITETFLGRTISLTEQLLETAKTKGYEHVDKILLVGGSTFMPQVKAALEAKFSYDISLFDPNQAVAMGAALFGYKCQLDREYEKTIRALIGDTTGEADLDQVDQAVIKKAQEQVAVQYNMALPGLKKILDTKITNVTSKSFGIVVVDSDDGVEKVNNLIVVDDKVPAKITKTFATHSEGQDGVSLRCVENLDRTGSEGMIDLDEELVIGTGEFSFGKPLPKGSPVEISFRLAEDGLLSIFARDLTTGKEFTANFETEAIRSAEEHQAAKSRNLAMKVTG
jgi:molecular chaperone DnaK (HSP70)